jgi:hypothetical protein
MNNVVRQGMVKQVTVREFNNEAKFLKVTVKVPTDLPIGHWSTDAFEKNVDEVTFSVPLDMAIRPGDLVGIHIQIEEPHESVRFQPALEAGVEAKEGS